MYTGPLIDWNGNGRIDPSDVAIGLAIAEEEKRNQERPARKTGGRKAGTGGKAAWKTFS